MRTDLMIEMKRANGELEILNPFIVNILFFADDGFLYEIRFKEFKVQFSAKDLEKYISDWEIWPKVSTEQFENLKRVYYKKHE